MSFALGSRGISPSAYSKLVEEREWEEDMLIVDPQRAVIAAVVVIAIGLFIFVYRNKKTWKSRLVKKYE